MAGRQRWRGAGLLPVQDSVGGHHGIPQPDGVLAELGCAFADADSASDLPLLRTCGHPVAVNPDRRLRAVAQREGWPILSFG